MNNETSIEAVIAITTVYPELVAWVAAISFFVSVAMTAIISPGRKWFELVVILGLCFGLNLVIVWLIVQWVAGVPLVTFEAIEQMSQNR